MLNLLKIIKILILKIFLKIKELKFNLKIKFCFCSMSLDSPKFNDSFSQKKPIIQNYNNFNENKNIFEGDENLLDTSSF